MKFVTMRLHEPKNHFIVDGHEVMGVAVCNRDDLELPNKKPKRLVNVRNDFTKYVPRILYKNKDGMAFYIQDNKRHYLSIGDIKDMGKALKKARKARKKELKKERAKN